MSTKLRSKAKLGMAKGEARKLKLTMAIKERSLGGDDKGFEWEGNMPSPRPLAQDPCPRPCKDSMKTPCQRLSMKNQPRHWMKSSCFKTQS